MYESRRYHVGKLHEVSEKGHINTEWGGKEYEFYNLIFKINGAGLSNE